MKKYLTAFLSVICSLSTMGIYQQPQHSIKPWDASGSRDSYSLGANNWSHAVSNHYSGSWAFDHGTMNESYGGSQSFYRGDESGDTTLYIHGSGNGTIAAIVQNNGDLESSSTDIIVDPGVVQTSSLRTIALYDNHRNDRSVGNWTILGGTYKSSAFEALNARTLASFSIDSAAFISGGSGGYSGAEIGSSVTIKNTRERNDILYQAGRVTSGTGGSGLSVAGDATISGGGIFLASTGSKKRSSSSMVANVSGHSVRVDGGSGAVISGTVNIDGTYTFIAGESGNAFANGNSASTYAIGGHGAAFGAGSGTMSNSYFEGTSGGKAEIFTASYLIASKTYSDEAKNARAYAHGGSGLLTRSGNLTLINSKAYGAAGGSASANYTNNYADASGGNGAYTRGTLTVTGGEYVGARGGTANARISGEAYAFGGSGILAAGTGIITINGGTFVGAAGGKANGVAAEDGSGVRVEGGTLNIHGGNFSTLGSQNNGIYVTDANLTMNNDIADTVVAGNVTINADAADTTATFGGGQITGDIYKKGSMNLELTVNSAMSYSGAYIQEDGSTTVKLNSSDESKFFTDVTVQAGNMTFSGAQVLLSGANFTMGGVSNTLDFGALGAKLDNGTSVNGGFNTVKTDGTLELGNNAILALGFNTTFDTNGVLVSNLDDSNLNVGTLILSNSSARISATGISAEMSGSVQISTGAVAANTNLDHLVDANFGWLTTVTNIVDSGGLLAEYEYNSLTNSTLSDLGSVLTNIDAVIIGLTNTEFYALNSIGAENADELFRYSISQLPDVSESSFQISQQLNEQIAARGTEFRSMNGFASSKPNFGTSPTGVAGPQNKVEEEKTMQGWVRAYGGKGSKDASDKFAEYDTTSWGTVIGVDKSFGNLLVGLAGGYARTDLDAGAAYNADVDTYHGSVYSTFGGESFFLDLALTYGCSSTDENNGITTGSFDSSLYSAYIGAGYAFDIGDKISITPEASILASYYTQEEYDRSNGVLGNDTVKEYDTSSYLGSIGVNLATQHQLDWLNRGIAFIPEARAHYIHEFNADPDDFTYIIGGTPTPFAVRSRDEHLFRFGFGFDMWSWKYANTKFEIDYDILTSDTYFEQIVSGKATWRF